jgi:chromosome segregation ATPase
MSSASEQPGAAGLAGASDALAAGPDPGVLGVIAELQGKLSALGKAHEEKLKRDEAALAERIRQAEATDAALAKARKAVEDDAKALEGLRAELDADRAALDKARADVQARERAAGELHAAAERARGELAEREAKLKAAEAGSKERERKSQESAARAAAAAAEAAKEAAARAADAIAAIERAEAAEAELERARSERGTAQSKLDDECAALRAAAAELTSRLERAEAAAAEAGNQAASLREQLAQAQAEAESGATASAGAASSAQVAEFEARLAALNEQVNKRDQAIDLLRAKLREASEHASAGSRTGAAIDESVALRRKRLSRYRQLVQNEARKIVAAKDVLGKRQAECELVLAQRAKLVQQAQALAAREAKAGSRRSLVEAAAGVCFAVGAVLLVAVISWGAVSQMFPATYIASAVVAAEPKSSGREPDLAAWQAYHEQLVTDPRLMEEAAERMGRRGIASLASAPALSTRLKTDLMVTSDKPGMIRLELRGQGSERTARELETFVTALVAMANAARETRADGAGSVQSQPAAAGTEPVADQRLMYTGAFTAGGTGLAAIVGLAAWMQLSRAKRRYEAAGLHEE